MATLRCEDHTPYGRVRPYVAKAKPLGYPNTVTCGAGACPNPALLWLDAREKEAYDRGERVFRASGASTGVRVQ